MSKLHFVCPRPEAVFSCDCRRHTGPGDLDKSGERTRNIGIVAPDEDGVHLRFPRRQLVNGYCAVPPGGRNDAFWKERDPNPGCNTAKDGID